MSDTMSRSKRKYGMKSNWRAADRRYRQEQRERRSANRRRKEVGALFRFMTTR